jgi:hypothetical protein
VDKKLSRFFNWVEIKCKDSNPYQINSIVYSTLKFSETLKHTRESLIRLIDSDIMKIIRFVSKILKKVKFENIIEIILNYLSKKENQNHFSTFMLVDSILNSKQSFNKNNLSFDSPWYYLFSNLTLEGSKNQENKFINNIKLVHNLSSKHLLENELIYRNLNRDEFSKLLISTSTYYIDYYNIKFPEIMKSDKNLIDTLCTVIQRCYMLSGDQEGYQLAKYQFFHGMDIESIKLRVDGLHLENFTKDEQSFIKIFLKAYNDNFQKERYYNFKTLEIM